MRVGGGGGGQVRMARGMGEVGVNGGLGVGGADMPARNGVRRLLGFHVRGTILVGIVSMR